MTLPRRRGRAALGLVLACCATAGAGASCGGSVSVRAARECDLGSLRAAIARERNDRRLDGATVREIAKTIADRDLRRSAPAETLARIDEARGCAGAVSDSLDALAKREGDVGAAASLALLDRGGAEGDADVLLRRYGASPNPLWRAVAARSAVSNEHGPARRAYYVDPDERVRLAALRAALERTDRADRSALLEAARLDPNPLAQSLATRALGAVADEELVLALRDLYARADEGLRQSIVDAWGHKEAAEAGGLRELVRVAENERGSPSIEAGWVLLRFQRAGQAAVGTNALLRGIRDGLPRDRLLAIMDAPAAEPQVTAALGIAATSTDGSVRVAALSRLIEVRATRALALCELEVLAESGSKAAFYALARTGDRGARETVAKDLSSPDREARLLAARTLVDAGDLATAADLLADSDPHVRMQTACAMLNSRAP
jgi:hypothetical protein